MKLPLAKNIETVLPSTTAQVFPVTILTGQSQFAAADFKTEYFLLYNLPKATIFGGFVCFVIFLVR